METKSEESVLIGLTGDVVMGDCRALIEVQEDKILVRVLDHRGLIYKNR